MSLIGSSGRLDVNVLAGFLITSDRCGLVSSCSSVAGVGRSGSTYFHTLFASA
jgi:hypothetical protein